MSLSLCAESADAAPEAAEQELQESGTEGEESESDSDGYGSDGLSWEKVMASIQARPP